MKQVNLTAALESLLFAAGDEGLTSKEVGRILELDEKQAIEIVAGLQKELEEDERRGITVAELAGSFQLVTKRKYSPYLHRLAVDTASSSLSQAAMETLAIIAYNQPVTKLEVEEIRGVKTDRPIKNLLTRGLIKDAGRKEGVGRPILYATTREFLDYFGLKNISELPPLPQSPPLSERGKEEVHLFNTLLK